MENNKVWIARDKDGLLFAYDGKPSLSSDKDFFVPEFPNFACLKLPRYSYSEVTFENSPLPLEVLLDYGK